MKQLNWYQIFGKSNIPDGKTITPTDDIQIWLHCANIWDKTYTTLAEILADTDTLSALINSENAVDYMVRSTTWAVQISVPTMTSNTTPSGIASGSGTWSTADFYKAFDNNESDYWQGSAGNTPGGNGENIKYTFTSAVTIDYFKLKGYGYYAADDIYYFKIQGSNDGVTWVDLTEKTQGKNNTFTTGSISKNKGAYTSYRAIMIDSPSSTAFGVYILQFYSASITADATAMTYIGQNNYCANTLLADAMWCEAICNSEYFESVLNVKAPKMTSNTTPEGECFANASRSTALAPWKAFDGDSSTAWRDAHNTSTSRERYIGYKFNRPVKIVKYSFVGYSDSGLYSYPASFDIQGSDDNETWNAVKSSTASGDKEESFQNDTAYASYRLYSTNWHMAGGSRDVASLRTLQFYGREDI